MKTKIFTFFIILFLFLGCLPVSAKASDNNAGMGNANQNMEQEMNQGEEIMLQNENQNQEQEMEGIEGIDQVDNPEATILGEEDESDEELGGRARGQANAQQHRSTVANFVQSLVHVADREGGIGEQVRVIAREQNQAAEDTVQAMEKVQTRSRIKTFFLGPDYKNIGQLRSEMVKTRNRLEQLNRLMEKAEGEESQLTLQEQIQEMEQEQVRIQNFIEENEDKFSLFGWLVRFFGDR